MDRSDIVTIRRTGLAPLRLENYGLVAHAGTSTQQGPRSTRWWEIELWACDERPASHEQTHCIVVRYRTTWQDEQGHDAAEVLPRREVAAWLSAHDPMQHVLAYPPGEQFAARQERLLRELRLGWHTAVSELLEQAGVWELTDDRE